MKIRVASSVQFLEQLAVVRTALEQKGHRVELPRKDEKEPVTKEQKRKYLEKLQQEIDSYDVLLVMNYAVEGKRDAIAPTVLLQVGVARYFEKAVFVYGDFPQEYREELVALGVQALRGDLTKF